MASFYSFIIRKDTKATAILSGLAFLARPDTLLLPLLFGAYYIIKFKKLPIREILILFIIAGPWILFSAIYFGHVIPNSIIAKSNAYLLHPFQATTTILGYIATRSPITSPNWPLWVIGLSLLINIWLFIIGSISMIRRDNRSTIMVLFALLYIIGLMVANPLIFIWYLLPFTVLHISFIIVGLYTFFRGNTLTTSVGVILLFLSLLLFFEWKVLDQPSDGCSVNLRDHEALYEMIAETFKGEIPEGSSIALPEIGVFGYLFPESPVLDTVGIISPEAIKYQYKALQSGQVFSYAIPTDLILDLKPDYLFTLDVFLHPHLLTSNAFNDQYQVIAMIPTNAMGSTNFYVFKHKLSNGN